MYQEIHTRRQLEEIFIGPQLMRAGIVFRSSQPRKIARPKCPGTPKTLVAISPLAPTTRSRDAGVPWILACHLSREQAFRHALRVNHTLQRLQTRHEFHSRRQFAIFQQSKFIGEHRLAD